MRRLTIEETEGGQYQLLNGRDLDIIAPTVEIALEEALIQKGVSAAAVKAVIMSNFDAAEALELLMGRG